MQKKSTTPRKPREPNHTEVAAKLEQLLSSDQLSDGQEEILTDLLLELSSDSGVCILHPALVGNFYMLASEKQAEEIHRGELHDIFAAIEKGEEFTGYQYAEGLEGYRRRQRGAQLTTDKSVSPHLRRKLREILQANYIHMYKLAELIERAEASWKKGGTK